MMRKMLIADDDPNLLVSLEYLMKREGYEVHIAHDGQDALDVLRRERPELLLLDISMPRKSGYEVCHELRQDDALKDTRVLMLSARSEDVDVSKGMGLGANAYLTKPFGLQELLRKVGELESGFEG